MFRSTKKEKVYVGLSGGVDSGVSAALLKKAGYAVTGVFIKIQIEGYPCPAKVDRIEAMRVAAHLDIPFLEIDLSKEYQHQVFSLALKEFERGRTPNPDALCNREIKFGAFYEFARSRGAEYVATGHYAQVKDRKLFAGVDESKDQSYFLWAAPNEVLKHTLFPVGHLEKTEVRKLAKEFGLPNAVRRDSQGLCFLGDVGIDDMLTRELTHEVGPVLSLAGEKIGEHKGARLYTLGERHGFTLYQKTPNTKAHYVIKKDLDTNSLTVSTSKFPAKALATELSLIDTNWIGEVTPGTYTARYRYRQALVKAKLSLDGKNARVTLLEPHYAPLGQSLVLYDGDRCLGGGVIDNATILSYHERNFCS